MQFINPKLTLLYNKHGIFLREHVHGLSLTCLAACFTAAASCKKMAELSSTVKKTLAKGQSLRAKLAQPSTVPDVPAQLWT